MPVYLKGAAPVLAPHTPEQPRRFLAGNRTALASAGSVNAADYEAYSYDPNGNRTNLRKRDTRNIAFEHDALNRVTSKTYPQGGANPVYYGYDLRNLQLFARFGSASGEGVTNAWDGFGRLTSSSTNMGNVTRTLSYQYDANSNRIRITHPDTNYFTATYDGLNRQFWIHEQGIHGKVVAGYNPFGSFAGTSRNNGTLTNYGYDGLQRPNAYYHDLGGTAADGLWLFSRNPAGQIASTTRENDAYAWTSHYAVSRPYTTDGLNRYTTAGTPGPGQANFGYDLNGNLTSDGTRTFTYDVENRLIWASPNVALSYDPLGRLYEVSGTSGTTRFLYDGDALVAEYNTAGTMTRRYVHWTGADVPMMSYVGTDLTQLSQLHADERGSIIALTDSNGAAAINRYDEYGIPAPTNSGRFQFTGQIWLNELGMYHYKARVYSPYLGRFMQTDPIGYDDQFNLYAYVGNDPVNMTDPSGTYKCNGGRDDCKQIDRHASDVRRAARNASQMTGTRIRSNDARALSGIASFIGRAGQDNGVTIENGSLDGFLGTNDRGPNGSIILTLDLEAIANDSGSTGAGVLAHEATHGMQLQAWGGPTPFDTYHRELIANTMESLTNEYLGQSTSVWSPTMSARERVSRVRRSAFQSCDAARAQAPRIVRPRYVCPE